MTSLSILTDSFVHRLRLSIGGRLSCYQSAESWIEEFAQRSKWELSTNIELRLSDSKSFTELLENPSEDNLMDLDNSIRLHKALCGLTPSQARDPRLWVRLAHVEFWHYMRRRWPIERHLDDKDKSQRFIEQRYFVMGAEGRALLRHGIARLWWYAYLTHDLMRENPYELTAILLKDLDIAQQILERSMGRSRSVLIGFLEFLAENSILLSGGNQNRETIRLLAKSLNLFGGVVLLDCLAPTSVKCHLQQELNRIMHTNVTDSLAYK